MKHTLVLNLKPAPWRSEVDLGEAGIRSEWLVVDENGTDMGHYVEWSDGTSGLFVGASSSLKRVELPKGFARRVWKE